MQTIGITGATGFLGAYLLRYLHARGRYRVVGLTRSLKSDFSRGPEGITWQQGDLLSRADCLEFVSRVDTIVHFAHTNTALTSDRDLPADAIANLIPTLNLLESIRQSKKKIKIIYASSGGAVYGSSENQQAFKETDACNPISAYGVQKLVAEHYLRLAVREGNISSCILRISNPYGVLLPSERMQGFIGVALHRIRRKQTIKLFSPSDTVRDYLHIEDMCRGVEAAIGQDREFSIFNIGSGHGYSLQQVIAMIRAHVGHFEVEQSAKENYVETLPAWNVLDSSKASRELGWLPNVSLEQGLASFCEEVFSS